MPKLLLIVLVLLLLGGGYYFWPQINQQLNPQPVQVINTQTDPVSSDPTANWKIYKDSDSFTFKYPPDWDVNSEEPSSSEISNSKKQYSITINIDYQSFGDGAYYCQSVGRNTDRCEQLGVKQETIDTTAFIDWNFEEKKEAHVEIAGPWERGAVVMTLTPVNPETKNILKQILSTFKFTN